ERRRPHEAARRFVLCDAVAERAHVVEEEVRIRVERDLVERGDGVVPGREGPQARQRIARLRRRALGDRRRGQGAGRDDESEEDAEKKTWANAPPFPPAKRIEKATSG